MENTTENITGLRIKQRRLHLGITASELANKAGVHKTTITRYENGSFHSVKSSVLDAIAEALSVSKEWLLGKTDDMQPEKDACLLSQSDSCDICHIFDGAEQLLQQDNLTFGGVPADKDSVMLLKNGLSILLQTAELQNDSHLTAKESESAIIDSI